METPLLPQQRKITSCLWMKSRCSQCRTCRVVGMSKPRPSTEILTAILMPANRRLLFPITDCRALFRDWKGDGNTDCSINHIWFDFRIRCVTPCLNGWLYETKSLLCDKDVTQNQFKLNYASMGNSIDNSKPRPSPPQCAARGLFVARKGLPFFSRLPSHLAQLHTACWWPPCLGGAEGECQKPNTNIACICWNKKQID